MKLLALTITIASIVIECFNSPCSALSFGTSTSVSSLIAKHAAQITTLKKAAEKYPDAPTDSVFYLRYCLGQDSEDDEGDSVTKKLQSNLEWRAGEGKLICESAKAAVEAATSTGSSWDNTPVQGMAPHAKIVNKFITSSQCLTTATRKGDLVYVVRAGKIDDSVLMSEITVEEMIEFFLYSREVNAIVANARSILSDRLVSVITANDLTGVKLIGGDATFRNALSATSAQTNELYPGLSGPTLLLNLPRLLGALVKLFSGLFPKEVRKKIMFAQGPLRDVDNLMEISVPGQPREKLMSSLDELLYSDA